MFPGQFWVVIPIYFISEILVNYQLQKKKKKRIFSKYGEQYWFLFCCQIKVHYVYNIGL